MLHIIGLIFKIIGIILLIILGLLLVLILTVLFVPVRYRVKAEHGEGYLRMEGSTSWLLHLMRAKISHMEGVLHIRVKVLWFTLFDNLKPKKLKPEKLKSKKLKSEKHKPGKLKLKKLKSEKFKSDKFKSKSSKIENQEKRILRKPSDTVELIEEPPKASGTDDFNAGKKSAFQKILSKIRDLKERIGRFFSQLKEKLISRITTAVDIKKKVSLLISFVKNEINREGFQITYHSLKKLLKHVLPTKLKSCIVFGTGDPCSTGQALGVIGILYSFYGDKVQIIPDFEKKIFEGKHEVKGRIRLVTILIIVIKLILDKRFKQLRKNLQLLKEEL